MIINPTDFARVQEKAISLANDARRWAQDYGVAGGDDAEATMLLMCAAELIRTENGRSGKQNPATDRAADVAASFVRNVQ
jgi:hypothetical protein